MMPTYTVSTYDTGATPDDPWDWTVFARSVPLWGLRAILHELYGRGYDRDLSIHVQRDQEVGS